MLQSKQSRRPLAAPRLVLAGPRQCGKTTLARRFIDPASVNYFDLESPPSLARLDEPMTALAPLRGIVVIDEVQLREDLFPVLRVLVDRVDSRARFLVLGSASGNLLRQTSESLAGRTERVLLGGFTTRETAGSVPGAERTLWRRGGLPRSFLASTEEDSVVWRREYIRTLLERDFPQWGVRAPAATMAPVPRIVEPLDVLRGTCRVGRKESTARREKALMTHPERGAQVIGQTAPCSIEVRAKGAETVP